MDAGYETLVAGKEQCHAGRLINAPALGFDDPVFDLIAHPESVASADAVGFEQELYLVMIRRPIERHGIALGARALVFGGPSNAPASSTST